MKLTGQQLSWIIYDPACAAHALLVRTLFAAIFLQICADGAVADTGLTALWTATASIACLAAGIISVCTGPFADAKHCKRLFMAAAVAVCIVSCFGYLFCGRGDWKPVLIISFAGIAAFSVANSFYDSLLSDVAEASERDRLSTLGFASGYAGAILSALIVLPFVFLISGDTPLRIAFGFTGIWFAAGSLPLLLNVRERNTIAVPRKKLSETFRYIWQEKNILFFLTAYLLYIDTVGTIMFAAAPLAAGLKISTQWLLITILALQFLGLPFTLLYGHLAKKFSAKTMISCAVAVYMLIAVLTGVMSFTGSLTVRRILFAVIAFFIGTSQGGIQALSRSMFSRLIPEERAAELFSVYNIFGRFTTVIGPLIMIPFAVWLFKRPELGITLMLIPCAAGLFLLGKVKDKV